ncbi:Rossmann-like and DUF2520 domain-containing protein [Geofilum rhodophaeum]|uniref:Rossmann-like and DUF2520 domain-containing protein n=1 Tax=Geofilum rhodophaeum TaxID=1965019 RepID=UPI000B521D30|nr:Rossmann-like and DUF2520 domain-containing protein [Geofilum rhodophaeum]
MKVVIIGSGNVATHLGMALKNTGCIILEVFSRQMHNAECLAAMLEARAGTDLSKINREADLYLLSVSDASISAVAAALPPLKGVVAHTAGSIGMEELERFPLHGVLYPFQTFTKEKEVDFKTVPVLYEGNRSASRKMLNEVALSISGKVQKASGARRKALHVAAVFACNFVNHLYTLANDLMEKEGLDFSLLEPLIRETTQKALTMKPADAQTGPARRGDRLVSQAHLETLEAYPAQHDVYALLSESIFRYFRTKDELYDQL